MFLAWGFVPRDAPALAVAGVPKESVHSEDRPPNVESQFAVGTAARAGSSGHRAGPLVTPRAGAELLFSVRCAPVLKAAQIFKNKDLSA